MIRDLLKVITIKLNATKLSRELKNNHSVLSCLDDIKNYNNKDWEKYKSSFTENYNKDKKYYKNIIFKNDDLELILIKWERNAETTIHSHPKNGCILKLLEGKLKEERFINNKLYNSNELSVDSVGYMHDSLGSHKITALEDSYSLHLYSPPNYYD